MLTPPEKQAPYGTYALTGYEKVLFNVAQGLGKSWLDKRIGLVLRKLVLKNRKKIIDAEVFGFRARFFPLDDLGDRHLLFLPGFFNDVEFTLLSQILQPDDVFVDIGANVGMFSLWASKFITAQGHILALEPNPVAYDRLRFNLSLNDPHGAVLPLHIGVADRESSFDLYVDPTNLGSASILSHSSGLPVQKIHCRPLLTILRENGFTRIDALKIDIEGAEALALNPFFQHAPRSLYPRVVIIETDDNIDFRGFGYTFRERTKANNSIYTLEKR
jgi:FkbM family methyltransferase